jgi:hypothetical protein
VVSEHVLSNIIKEYREHSTFLKEAGTWYPQAC